MAREFVDTILSKKDVIKGTDLVDQPRVCLELMARGELDDPASAESEKHTHTVVVPQRVMNSFARRSSWYDRHDPDASRWRPGDFIAHVTGMHNERRKSIIRQVLSSPSGPLRSLLLSGTNVEHDFSNLPLMIQVNAIPGAPDAAVTALSDAMFSDADAVLVESNWRGLMITALLSQDTSRMSELQAI